MAQRRSSKNTSINTTKLPAIYNKIDWDALRDDWFISGNIIKKGKPTVLDYGAGKYTQHIKEFCNFHNFEYVAYDPYNGSTEGWKKVKPTIVICSNVLNVIDDDKVVEKVHEYVSSQKCPYMITVYEGNKSGVGKESKEDCYQRNQATKDYCYTEKNEIVRKNVILKKEYVKYLK